MTVGASVLRYLPQVIKPSVLSQVQSTQVTDNLKLSCRINCPAHTSVKLFRERSRMSIYGTCAVYS